MIGNWMAAALLLAVLLLSSSAFATPQLPGGLGGVFKKKPKDQPAQQQTQPSDADKKKGQDKTKTDDSGFGGTLTTKSSKKTTDTATLGFKGVGPDGQVDPEKLKESPNGDDERVAQLMTGVKTNPEEAKAFIDNGKLKSK